MSLETQLARFLMENHPQHAARVLEGLSEGQSTTAIAGLAAPAAARVIDSMEADRATDCLRRLPERRGAEILAAMPVHKAASLIRRLEEIERERVLGPMDDPETAQLRSVLAYPAGTAGSLMDPAVVAFPGDITADEALRRVRRPARRVRFYIFVTDRDHRLTGVLTLRELMHAPPTRPLSELAQSPVERVQAGETRDAILVHPGWSAFHALPVVDEAGMLVGVLRYETYRRLQAEAVTDRPPDLLVLGAALTHTWIDVATLFLDGFGGALARQRRDER